MMYYSKWGLGRWYLSKRTLKRWTLLVAIAVEVVGCMGEKNKEKDKEAVRNKKVKKGKRLKKTEMKTN